MKSKNIEKMEKSLLEHFNRSIDSLGREELFNYISKNYVVGYTYGTVTTRLGILNATLAMNGNENSFSVTEFGVNIKCENVITKKEVIEFVASLENSQDAFIVYALFNGIYGNQAEDLLHLTSNDIDLEKNVIRLEDREVPMDDIMIKLAKDALKERVYYVIDTGSKIWRTTEFYFNMQSPYLLKVRPSTKNNNGLNRMSYNGFRTRMKSILDYLGSNLSVTDIVTSGYAHRINNDVKKISKYTVSAWLKENNVKCSDYKLSKIIKELYRK